MADLIASSEGSKQKIQMGSRISLHFALLMPGGEEIDTTRRGKPAALTLGDGNLLPGFESALLGLSAGDDAQLIVPAEQAFGERVEANVRLLAKTLFAEFTSEEPLEPGLVVSFQAPDGELPGSSRQFMMTRYRWTLIIHSAVVTLPLMFPSYPLKHRWLKTLPARFLMPAASFQHPPAFSRLM